MALNKLTTRLIAQEARLPGWPDWLSRAAPRQGLTWAEGEGGGEGGHGWGIFKGQKQGHTAARWQESHSPGRKGTSEKRTERQEMGSERERG